MANKPVKLLISSRLLEGALAGFLATLPMTLFMRWMYRGLPWWEQRSPLEPWQITRRVTCRLGLGELTDEPEEYTSVGMLSHLGYGTAAGLAYAPIASWIPLPPLWKGIVYGLIVWTVSYLGWLPALEILPPATRHPRRRRTLMIGAHVVWGAVAGVIVERMEQPAS